MRHGQRSQRVLVVRTSRFVVTAFASAHTRWPGSDLRVAYQDGAEAELDAAGIVATARMRIPSVARLTPSAVLFSEWGRTLLSWRPDVVVIQWWNRGGEGHEAASRAALLLQPRGFHVAFEDGRIVAQSARQWLLRRAWRVVRGAAIVLMVAVSSAALWPISVRHARRERRRMSGSL